MSTSDTIIFTNDLNRRYLIFVIIFRCVLCKMVHIYLPSSIQHLHHNFELLEEEEQKKKPLISIFHQVKSSKMEGKEIKRKYIIFNEVNNIMNKEYIHNKSLSCTTAKLWYSCPATLLFAIP